MKYTRLAALALLSISLTSCQTAGGVMNSWPLRLMDQTASALLGYLAENELPANGRPATIEDRARKVEGRGMYAGRLPAAAGSPRQKMASR